MQRCYILNLHISPHLIILKTEVKAEQDKTVKLQAFDSTYFRGKSHFEDDETLFEDDETQNYLMFQPICGYFRKIGNSVHFSVVKSKRLPDESIKISFYIWQ